MALLCIGTTATAEEYCCSVRDREGIEPWVVAPEPLFDNCLIDQTAESFESRKKQAAIPIGAGAWHWFHEDLNGDNDGYGVPGLRGTFFWYITADPELELASGSRIGAHVDCRLREQDRFRSFYSGQIWTYEAYAYLTVSEFGTFKAGQIQNRFGQDWGGVFWGTAAFFDGIKFDPDYGVAWEGSQRYNDRFKVDHFCQFFFHEDNVNGSIPGADPESVVGYTEKNRGVVRLVPTWMHDNGATTAIGLSGLVGQIDSRRPDLSDQVVSGWSIDVTHTAGRLKLIGESFQTCGVLNPVRYTSGGPSNRLTNLLAEAQYVMAPFTHRASYSVSISDNPHGMFSASTIGTKLAVTRNVDVYFEYVYQRISGNANPSANGDFSNALSMIIQWRL